MNARPADAYLPRTVDREPDSFAAAAEQNARARVAKWTIRDRSPFARRPGRDRGRYASCGCSGPRRHPAHGCTHTSRGATSTDAWVCPPGSTVAPSSRRHALRERGATYTLEDYDSPDLVAVVRTSRASAGRGGDASAL